MIFRKIVLAPDSFKGTLSSPELCAVMRGVIADRFPMCEVVAVPIADGGEGTVACLLEALGGEAVDVPCTGPFGDAMTARYGLLRGGSGQPTAVIEMASAAGLPLAEGRLDPMTATTYGVGQLMRDTVGRGCRKIILGLGGSCTNDFGCGAAAALGVRFLDENGAEFIPAGGTLCRVKHIDTSGLILPPDTELILMCDIDSPVYGEQGAAQVFAPQKGADEAAVAALDAGLRHICAVVSRDLGLSVDALPGGGAAGAMGAGMYALCGGRLRPGIETILDTVNFDGMIADAQLVVTGEGCLDSQSLRGKAVSGVGRRAKAAGVPAVAIVGGAREGIGSIYGMGITAVFPINRLPLDFAVSRHSTRENVAFALDNVLRLAESM